MSESLTQGGEGESVVEVVAAVIERDGLILIARRHAASHLGGLWEFPGGKRQVGETPEEALVREILEELDVTVTVGERLGTVEWAYPDKAVRLSFFRCTVREEPRGALGQEIAWVARADLGRYDFPAADAGLVGWLSRG